MSHLTPARIPIAALLAAAMLGACAPTPVSRPLLATPETGAFVVRMGTDTLAVERYTRTSNRLEGELVVRSPQTATRRYTADLRPDGSVERLAVELHSIGMTPTPPPYRFAIDFGTDSATVQQIRGPQGDSIQTWRVATPAAAIPMLRFSYALQEQALMHARASGMTSGTIVLLPVGSRQTDSATVRPLGGDSVALALFEGPARARIDARGRLLGFDASESTLKVTAERVASADVAALAADFARRDQQGQAIGQLSPRDSINATIGGAKVSVAYGRPSKRGRQIVGGVIPWDQVWRTGANVTTHLRTDRTLVVGGATLAPGAYSLFTLPSQSGWKLIINRQIGRSGTVYDPTQDMARVDMLRESTPAPVEQFTIRLEPQGNGGVLRMAWDDTQLSVPFTVR